ncbi:MAG: DUF2017 family protein [Actinomycetota bacterium]
MKDPFVFRSDGSVAVRLPEDGVAMMRTLLDELEQVVTDPDAPTARRLFPPAYEDGLDELARRARADAGLIDSRLARLRMMREVLSAGEVRRGWWEATLMPDEVHSFIGVCNDARLVLGTLLDVTDEDQPRRYLPATDPSAATVNAYLWLGAVLETALGVISPDLGDDHAE